MTDTTASISAHPFQTGATVAPGGSLVLDHPADLPFRGGERVTVIITPSQTGLIPASADENESKEAMTSKSTFDTRTPRERAEAFTAWAYRPRPVRPLLSDEAISRESMYPERA